MDELSLKAAERKRADAIISAIGSTSQKTPSRSSAEARFPTQTYGFYSFGLIVLGIIFTAGVAYFIYTNFFAQKPALEPTIVSSVVAPPAPISQPQPTPSYTPPQQIVQVITPVLIQQTPAQVKPSRPQQTYTLPPPVTGPQVRQQPALQEPTIDDHTHAAEEYALDYFRYKYRMGSHSTITTSVKISNPDTSEIQGWDQYRTTGEALFNYYYSSGGFKNGAVKFEVRTEVKNGKVKVVSFDIVP